MQVEQAIFRIAFAVTLPFSHANEFHSRLTQEISKQTSLSSESFSPSLGIPNPNRESSVYAKDTFDIGSVSDIQSLETFKEQLVGWAKPDKVAGVYVQDKFAERVVQQPDGDLNFVSGENAFTQFGGTNDHVIGLLAHSIGEGKKFKEFAVNDSFTIIFGDGSTKQFEVLQIDSYIANSPLSTSTTMTDESGKVWRSEDIFQKYYTTQIERADDDPDNNTVQYVTMQTCYTIGTDIYGGRYFVRAQEIVPSENSSVSVTDK
jgi:hypothetical protein